jgi:Domain of unknown function (DUF4331)
MTSSRISMTYAAETKVDHPREGVKAHPEVISLRQDNVPGARQVGPLGFKDEWNATDPVDDKHFGQLLRAPGARDTPAGLVPPRKDLVAILLMGSPAGSRPGFQNYTRPNQADLLRLNMAIPPSTTRVHWVFWVTILLGFTMASGAGWT